MEELHNLDHSKQKRKLDIAWKGETWFKVKKDARPPQPSIATQDTSSRALPASHQQQQEQLQQKKRYTRKKPERPEETATSNHTQQQAFQDQRRSQQQRMTIGHEKDTSGKEST